MAYLKLIIHPATRKQFAEIARKVRPRRLISCGESSESDKLIANWFYFWYDLVAWFASSPWIKLTPVEIVPKLVNIR